ncbi:MAG: DUF485 domain-containing protein [Spartobacteria bacterium]|nr:DUF485 domain-containing protein [Spartobacteria bacterium]
MDADHSRVTTNGGAIQYKQRLGIVLCVLYALVYAGFVIVSVYDVTLMDTVMPLGLNLAVFYGLGLIVFALVLAMFYSRACALSEGREAAGADAPAAAGKGRDA